MAGTNYAGTTPITNLWVLDDGGELRYFLSVEAMAEAVLNGFAQTAESVYRLRGPSIQHFSAQGIADCSAFIDLVVPARNPNPNDHGDAVQRWLAGDKAEWQGLLNQAKSQRRVDKGVLAERLDEYRAAVLAKTPLPPVNPWAAILASPTTNTPRTKFTESETA